MAFVSDEIAELKKAKPILVTGSHRSGSSWVGKMLAAAPRVAYLNEPFNVDIRIGLSPIRFDHWFKYIDDTDTKRFTPAIRDVLSYNYPLEPNLDKVKTPRDFGKLVKDQYLSLSYKLRGKRPLMKDPIALFSAQWLQQTFDMDVLVMVRHPAAFCSSIKLKGWTFDFKHFLKQASLMENYLGIFEEDIRELVKARDAGAEKSSIEQAVVLWNCVHHTIHCYQQQHPDWLFIRHEDVSVQPVATFQAIYEVFKLEFTSSVEAKIREASGEHNPVEQQESNEFVRNSKENIHNWKRRLSKKEIAFVREKTHDVASSFYSEDEW